MEPTHGIGPTSTPRVTSRACHPPPHYKNHSISIRSQNARPEKSQNQTAHSPPKTLDFNPSKSLSFTFPPFLLNSVCNF
ncbi:hypothetical protein L6452_07808 [Arctium lappa]|uniref:Uncharacterized protein n=1 Tax=Arctium lappa TaxID=4217 RepID=A0ACB9ELF7_ARCLA|nr:hypothetical protein L6452_07808 [Arctium lappa]